jgi:FMN-dependent NADH-azoreductase
LQFLAYQVSWYPNKASDFVTPYLRMILGFLGITDVTVITAAGAAMDKDAAIAGAQTAIEAL